MIKIIVLIVGLALIGFIAWWFFGKHAVATETANVADNVQQVDVDVNGGIHLKNCLKKGVPAVLNFTVVILLLGSGRFLELWDQP